ncbi:MAG: ATP-binding protein [bacterium]
MAHESFTDRELRERVHWLIKLRWLACCGVLISLLIARAIRLPFSLVPFSFIIQFVLLALLAVSNAVFGFLAHKLARREVQAATWRSLAYTQIACDLLILTLQIHFAGGIENPFKLFYIFHVILASILLSRASTYLFATVGSVFYTLIVVGERIGWLEHHRLLSPSCEPYSHSPVVIVGKIAGLVGALFFTSYIATSVTRRLRQREAQLTEMAERLAEHSRNLEEANQALERAGEERMRFLRMVEHELRTPLAAIQSCLQTVMSGYAGKLDNTALDMVSRAAARSSGMLELVQDLLALTKSERLAERPGDEQVDIQAILQDEVEMQRPLAEKKNLRFHLSLDSTAPVTGLSDMVQRVFANLISNAIRYTPDNGDITVSSETRGDSVAVIVQDSGIGITPEEQSRLFEEFFRSERAREMVSDGTGLGLAFVKRVIDSMSGTIEVDSRETRGTTFKVVLPIR